MRAFLPAALAAVLAAPAAPAADAPPFYRGVYVVPTNRPVYRMGHTRVYVNGQAVERYFPAGYASVYPRYVDRPGPVYTHPVGEASSVPVYPVITGSWTSPGRP